MATQLFFAFDSEDYITPEAAHAEWWWADTFSRHDVPVTICVVGQLARALRDRGERETIAAMSRHDISYHSDTHSIHPTHAEYLEPLSWDEGVAAVLAREARGISDAAEVFGQWPASFCKAGYSWGPPVPEAMRRMGIPMLSDGPFEWSTGRPMWYQNMLSLAYHFSFDEYFCTPPPDRLRQMQADFEERLRQFEGGTMVMYTHPCRLVTADFWDALNFMGGRNTPPEAWRPAPLRPAAEVEELKRDIDEFVGWVARRQDVSFTNARAFEKEHRQPHLDWVTSGELLDLLARTGDPPEPAQAAGVCCSPAEILAAAARAAASYSVEGRLPEQLALRHPLGPVESQPPAQSACEVPIGAVLQAAVDADREISRTGRLPASARVGGADLGPNAILQALRVLVPSLAHRRQDAPDGELRLECSGEQVRLAQREDFASLGFRGSWCIFAPEFEAPRMVEMARWQAWTGKPAAHGRAQGPAAARPSERQLEGVA